MNDTPLRLANTLYLQAPLSYSEGRSSAYKAGVVTVLLCNYGGGAISKTCPFAPGSAEMSDFNQGCTAGADIWRIRKSLAVEVSRVDWGNSDLKIVKKS